MTKSLAMKNIEPPSHSFLFAAKKNYTHVVQQAHYTPEIGPCYIYLFTKFKRLLKEKKLDKRGDCSCNSSPATFYFK